jgi:hypothetical protein
MNKASIPPLLYCYEIIREAKVIGATNACIKTEMKVFRNNIGMVKGA